VALSSGSSIPANGNCTLTVNVSAAVGGSYINTLSAGALMTNNGNNAAPAVATLSVVYPTPIAIPTLSEWAMIVLAALMAITGFVAMRGRPR
jgi:hypothetical protein